MLTRSLSLTALSLAVGGSMLLPGTAYADHDRGRGGDDRQHPRGQQQASAKPKPKPSSQPSADRRKGSESGRSTSGPDRGSERQGRNDPKGRRTGSPTGAPADPRGNNGTIKVDFLTGDSGHANRPHPGCGFQLRMVNFDDDQRGTVAITGQAPTRTGVLLSRHLLLSADPAGGGSDADEVYSFTASELGLLGTEQGPQGWHLKVAVDADDAPGGAKQKVFWLDCAVPTRTEGTSTSLIQAPAPERPLAQNRETARLIRAEAASVLEVRAQSAVQPTPHRFGAGGGFLRGGALPFTGASIGLVLAGAAASLGLGALAVRAGRRRSSEAS